MTGVQTCALPIYHSLDPQQKSDLVSLATSGDRTLFFDFMSLKTPTLNNFTVRFQLYTVPGQQIYTSTRQLVLRGADGIVFVVDSGWDRMPENVESFQDLQENLLVNNLSLAQIPYVIQYNKRDLPEAATVDYLEYAFNNRAIRAPSFEAVASRGEGVVETLNAIAKLLMIKYSKKIGRASCRERV